MARTPPPSNNVSSPPYQARKLFIVLKSQAEHRATEIDEGDDFTDSIKETLVQHVAEITKNNQFPVVGGLHTATLTLGNGNPASLSQADDNGQATYLSEFAKAGSTEAVEAFKNTSNSGQLGDGFEIRKGKETSDAPSGDEIFRSVDKEGDASPFVKRVQQVLVDNNSYNSQTTFVDSNNPTQSDDDLTLGSIAFKRPGVATSRKFPTVETKTADDQITIREMKKVALLTMLQATGELVQPNLSENSVDAISEIGQATTLVPGVARMGIRIAASRFAPANVVKAIKPGFQRNESTSFLDGKTVMSYGSVNSYFVPFEGLSNAPSILSATIMTATVTGLLKSLSLLRLVQSGEEYDAPFGDPTNRKRWLGSYRGVSRSTDVLGSLLEFVPTNHEFFACLDKGISVFFGFDTESPTSFVSSAGSQLTKLHGYYNVVLRNVIRSVNDLVSPVAESVGEGQGNNYRADALDVRNTVDPLTNIKKLNNSALIKFINILITIGDLSLSREEQLPGLSADSDLMPSDIDSVEESLTVSIGNDNITTLNPSTLVAKNRLSTRAGSLAMGNTTLRSLLMVPANLLVASDAYPDTANIQRMRDELATTNTIATYGDSLEPSQARIKADIVKQVEDYLERDYMPFYFHDIRTNEILAFHAFLGDISEGLSADYNETEGYGRVGGVYTYKNTKREISLSFKMLATNENDFDQMWYKINRLAAMLYPQWTEGRRVSFGQNNRFVQPFSQVPGASPLVRLRLGDLWKSNYSKFAVARLFGLANGVGQDGAFSLQNLTTDASAAQTQRNQLQVQAQRGQRIYADQQLGNYLGVGNTSTTDQQTTSQRVRLKPGRYPIIGRRGSYYTTNTEVDVRLNERRENVNSNTGVVTNVRYSAVATTPSSTQTPSANSHRGSPTSNLDTTNAPFVVTPSDLIPRMDYILENLRGVSDGNTGVPSDASTNASANNAQEINRFFNATNNPVMKAFESTKGRGLAGFIRSMRMDYKEATWVTDRANGRAPMLVQIDMDFIPIHDIQPGLDSNGFMTAPIWNVGNIVGNMSDASQLRDNINLLQQSRSRLVPPQR